MARKTHKVTVTIEAEVSANSTLATCRTGRDVIVDEAVRAALASAKHTADHTDIKSISVEREELPEVFTKWPFRAPEDFWSNTYYWVDAKGVSHAIEYMSLDYVSNVLYLMVNEEYKVRDSLPAKYDSFQKYKVTETPLFNALQRHLIRAANGGVQRPVK